MSRNEFRFGDRNSVDIKCYSFDIKVKHKTHFQLSYDFNTTYYNHNNNRRNNNNHINGKEGSAEDTDTADTARDRVFCGHGYRRDSLQRFGDDLTQLILSHLPLADKFRLECVSRQWQSLVYTCQHRLVVANWDTVSTPYVYSPALVVRESPAFYVLSTDRLRRLLGKCRLVREICVKFNAKYRVNNEFYFIDGSALDAITEADLPLRELTVCAVVRDLTPGTCQSFAAKYGHCLRALRFKHMSDKEIVPLFAGQRFPSLQKLDINSVNGDTGTDLLNTSQSDPLFPKLSSIKFKFNGFDGLRAVTGREFGCLKTLDIVLDAELNAGLCGDGVNRALHQLSELKTLDVFNIKIFVENTEITAIDTGLKKIADNCPLIKRLDFIMDSIELNGKLFDLFSRFRAVEYCEISIEYNEDMDDYGSLQAFANCHRLRVFNMYLYNICDQHLVDIHRHLPRITNFHLRSKTGITDATLQYLKLCRRLEVFEVHTYDDPNTRIGVTDAGVCQLIRECPKLRFILLFSRSKNMSFNKTIQEFVAKAKRRPKVRHCLGSSCIVEMCDRLAKYRRKFTADETLAVPPNLRLIELPYYTDIRCLDYYCNEDIPESFKAFKRSNIKSNHSQ